MIRNEHATLSLEDLKKLWSLSPGEGEGEEPVRARLSWVQRGLLLAVAFLTGHIRLLGGLSPLDLALFGAGRELFAEDSLFLAAGLLGGAFLRSPAQVPGLVAGMMLFVVGYGVWRQRQGKVPLSLTALLVYLAALAQAGLLSWGSWSGPLLLAAALLPVLLLPLYRTALRGLVQVGILEQPLPLFFLFAITVSGLGGLEIGGMRTGVMLGGFLVLLAARFGGAGLGAATGTVVGAVLVLTQVQSLSALGPWALGGLLSGTMAAYGQWLGGLGYLVGSLLFVARAGPVAHILRDAGERLLPCLLFWALPEGLIPWRPRAVERATGGDSSSRKSFRDEVIPTGKDPLPHLSQAFAELAATAGQWYEEENGPVEETGGQELDQALASLRRRVCAGCRFEVRCWQEEFFDIYHGLRNILTRGMEPEVPLPKGLAERCPRLRELGLSLDLMHHGLRHEERQAVRLREAHELLLGQWRMLGETFRQTAGRTSSGPVRLHLSTAVAQRPSRQEVLSGDSTLVRNLEDGRMLLALADGMGVGKEAARTSRFLLRGIELLIVAGLEEQIAAEMLNRLVLVSTPRERTSSLDLLLFDGTTGSGRLLKVASAPTLLRRGRAIEVLYGNTPPIGALPELMVERHQRMLRPGDELLFLSDGLLEAAGGMGEGVVWLEDLFATSSLSPQTLAETVLAAARARSPVSDDCSVLVARVEKE